MKAKTINAVLTKKFNQFLGSIENEKVKELVRKNSIITGGAIVSLLLNEKVNDYDIYFTNKETVLAVCHYYATLYNDKHNDKIVKVIDQNDGEVLENDLDWDKSTQDRVSLYIKSDGIVGDQPLDQELEQAFELGSTPAPKQIAEKVIDPENTHRIIFITSNAITLSDKVQLVIRFYGDAKTIHENYDYVHATSYWESLTGKVFLNPAALESILTKELIYIGSRYPVCSIIRMKKFISKGWTINAGNILKMIWQTNELDLTNINVLKDQLVGVDTAYFNMLITALEEKKEKEPDFKVSYGYVAEIINRIF